MNPNTRRHVAAAHLAVSLIAGLPLSWWLPTVGAPWFERVLLAISFYAITITALDVLATADVRVEQEAKERDDTP